MTSCAMMTERIPGACPGCGGVLLVMSFYRNKMVSDPITWSCEKEADKVHNAVGILSIKYRFVFRDNQEVIHKIEEGS